MKVAGRISLFFFFIIYILIFCSCFCFTSSAAYIILDEEIDALLSIKQSLQDPMGNLDTWTLQMIDATSDYSPNATTTPVTPTTTSTVNYTLSPCSWTGVLCSSIAGGNATGAAQFAVTALDISHMNLSGVLSPAVGRLRHLVSLNLAANNLSGSLPPEIAAIGTALRYLNVSNNAFVGGFPSQNLTNLANIQVLDAYNNNFEGLLPVELSQLKRIRHLHLGGNYFNASIPPQYGGMQSLTYLALSGNSLTGRIPVELGNLKLLKELYMGYFNQFDGGIPASLGSLTELVVLDMAHCGLNGSIPAELMANLTNLESLYLYTNSLTGPIPAEVGQMRSLKNLDLSNNRLTGVIPDEVRNLTNLELLHLFRNRIGGNIPTFIGDLPALQVLSLWQNRLTGTVPQQLGANGNLTYVDMSSNLLSGRVPPGVCAGGKLEVLILFNNLFAGPIPETLANCTALTRVRLGQNRLTGTIPAGLLALPGLQMIEIPANRLSGFIPDAIPFNAQLGRLDLSGNQVLGSIPAGIGNLSALESLMLAGNALSGSIPAEIGKLKRLSKLDCGNNKIGGSIPAQISQCAALTYLDLSNNQLESAIPAKLSSLAVLNFLNLSRNHLTGSIPASLQEMQTLTAADFSYNNLSGVIPNGGQFTAFNASSFVGNPALCGVQLLISCNSSAAGDGAAAPAGYDDLLGGTRKDPEVTYWVIVAVMSTLTVTVLAVALFYNRHSLYAMFGSGNSNISRLSKFGGAGGGGTMIPASPGYWKLTVFQKVDFTASHVLACLTDDNIIGKGGSGTVYRCATPSGHVAVKRLPSSRGSNAAVNANVYYKQQQQLTVSGSPLLKGAVKPHVTSRDDHGFSAEIETLGKIRHRNIVRLLGCCSSRETNFLVYEYMPNGSLGELLHGPRGGELLDWGRRYRIALEAANGLRYLHHDCSPRIVHRDVKSNNILLDAKFEAHVADFGLARPISNNYPDESMSSVAGSYGYIAPEYVYTLTVNEKSDIYSFGIVLLELLTGRRPLEPEFGEGVNIAHWVRKIVGTKAGVLKILDPRLNLTTTTTSSAGVGSEASPASDVPSANSNQDLAQAMLVLRVALHCLAELPVQRPTMREVVQMLSDFPPSSAKGSSSSLSLMRRSSSSNGSSSSSAHDGAVDNNDDNSSNEQHHALIPRSPISSSPDLISM